MQWFSYLDKREVLQQEYSQSQILPTPHFRWVVNHVCFFLFVFFTRSRAVSLVLPDVTMKMHYAIFVIDISAGFDH